MIIKINGVEIAAYPTEFSVTPMDLDNGDSTTRAADGTLNRDRVAVKRQVEMTWSMLDWATTSKLLKSMSDIFFDLYYPDPMDGTYSTRTFYVGNRPTPFAYNKNGTIMWAGLKATLTEK
ncbi:DUF6711 family protein [Desulfosporosinus sp. Sb-LF]|uniref:DUF6711 family protein n=1 Tax=Desulfosporosinus sp. Sb-LF TaxID=2560027 RepID=UPI00107F61AE|nr:DUF6711 family protein [Desulfosporosinus sp. Sb-LF]TGE31333.1 hypothetical protein E4K68_17925 [Desulfosporosinus sp. Sb-LF]